MAERPPDHGRRIPTFKPHLQFLKQRIGQLIKPIGIVRATLSRKLKLRLRGFIGKKPYRLAYNPLRSEQIAWAILSHIERPRAYERSMRRRKILLETAQNGKRKTFLSVFRHTAAAGFAAGAYSSPQLGKIQIRRPNRPLERSLSFRFHSNNTHLPPAL